jgi:hypothetical protein
MNLPSFTGRLRRLRRLLSHSGRGEAWEKSEFRLGAHAPRFTCCPIEIEEVGQIEAIPDDPADHCE